jgi:polar amino acid transport system substrate-binding protein
MTPRSLHLVCATVLAVAAGACVQVDPPPFDTPPPTTTTTRARPDSRCDNPRASYRPEGPALRNSPGDYLDDIRQRGRIRVGVDSSTYLFSSYDSRSGKIEGFDVAIAREVAWALFRDRDAVELVVVPNAERLEYLEREEVDMVAETFSITCDRWKRIAFSTEYLTTKQRLLVPRSSDIRSVADLTERHKVCAANGSTSLGNLATAAPDAQLVPGASNTDCLVRLQHGEIDAISTDETILLGFQVQDPTLHLVGGEIANEPYGLGLPLGHEDWVRYVNAVLAELRSSGRWQELYETYLTAVGPVPDPPKAAYGREP